MICFKDNPFYSQCNQLGISGKSTLQQRPSRDKRSCRSPSYTISTQVLLPTVNSAHFTSTSSIWYLLDILVDSLQNVGQLTKLLLAREGKVMSPGSSVMETPSQSFASPQVPIFGSIFHYCNNSNSTNISGSYPWWIILRPVAGSSPALRMSATGSWAMHR